MKAFVCSVGEKTTQICCDQLKKFGFEVVLLDKKEPWIDKYKRFINEADEDCLRVDADTIVNKNIISGYISWGNYMTSFRGWDFYKNDIGVIGCMRYSKKGLEILKKNIDKIKEFRPETSAWRDVFQSTNVWGSDLIVGIHGAGQDRDAINRAIKNKKERGQFQDYDFDLVIKLLKL